MQENEERETLCASTLGKENGGKKIAIEEEAHNRNRTLVCSVCEYSAVTFVLLI